MQFFRVLLVLTALVAPAHCELLRGDAWEDAFRSEVAAARVGLSKRRATRRQRIELRGICNDIFAATLGGLLPGTTCDCEPSLSPPSLSVICESVEPVCVIPDVLCGVPGVGVSIDLSEILNGGLPVAFEVCFNDPTILDIAIPEILPFCISPGSGVLGGILGGILGGQSTGANSKSMTTSTAAKVCSARLGDVECNSCTVCDESVGGVLLNCENIQPGLVSKQCTPLPFFFAKK